MGRGMKLLADRATDILVMNLCSEACAAVVVAHYDKKRQCIWCGNGLQNQAVTRGFLREPYCSEQCFKAAGHAMATYEVKKGNLF